MRCISSLRCCLVVFLLLPAVACKNRDSKPPALPETRAKKLSIGAPVAVTEKLIPASGGVVRFREEGHPLNWFTISIPDSAYPQDQPFKISYAEIKEKELIPGMAIVSPLVQVENGGEYAEMPLSVTIPHTAPEGEHVMVFFYDEETGQREALPVLAQEKKYITVLTRHFSALFAVTGGASDDPYRQTYATGFEPGVDDWQMANPGKVYLSPGGQCSGESLTMMWYYTEGRMPDKNLKGLNGLLEGNGTRLTPGFWNDDAKALKFCAIIQDRDYLFRNDGAKISKYMEEQWKKTDEETMKELVDAFRGLDRPRPQYIAARDNKSGHALVVYKVENGTLYVADPNYPGTRLVNGIPVGINRKIVYDPSARDFKDYVSGRHTYTDFMFLAEWALVPKNMIANFWKKTIEGKLTYHYYPQYSLHVLDKEKNEVPFTNGYTLDEDGKLQLQPRSGHEILKYNLYDENEFRLDETKPLPPGVQHIGVEVLKDDSLWIGFDWVQVLVPNRRQREDKPIIYKGTDCYLKVIVDRKEIVADSITFTIAEQDKQMNFYAYQRAGGKAIGVAGVLVSNFTGTGEYRTVIGNWIDDFDDPENHSYFETSENAVVKINEWGGGVLSGEIVFRAKELGGEKEKMVIVLFRYPR